MGLLVLAGIAALVLTALALVTTLIVQLVLWLSVRNTLLIVGVLAVYGFIDSRRRQVAKGFYSCKELAITSGTTTTSTTTTPAMASTPAPVAATTPTHSEPANDAQPAQPQETESTVVADTKPPHVTRQRSFSENATSSATAFPPSHTSDADDGATADSTSADVMRHSMSDADADLASFKPPPSTQLLPELRRKKWTKPSHSLPLKHKGESLLLRRSTSSATSGATSSPRRPELYGSPRSVAIEQKLMSNALESDGYFIGDFRLPPPPLVRRTHSTGTATPPRSASPALQDRTGPRAV